MNKERFEQIQKMSEDEKLALSKEEISEYYDYLAGSSNTSVSIPTEVYIEAGVEVATETLAIATNVNQKVLQVSQDLAKGSVPTTTVGVVGKTAVFLSMATNIYSMVKGDFKWDLVNTVNLVTSTLACLVLLGVNIACLGALATILASNPFTIALAVVTILINYVQVGEMASKLKRTYMSCYNSYRRIYKLCNWADTNEIIYKNFKSVLDFAKEQVLNIKQEFLQTQEQNTNMRRKIFIGADFNSFVLFNNVITFIQAKQELSTAKDGTYNDYIDFCSIEDYIDTHEILKQDLARIEYFILQNDLKSLKDFVISIDFLNGYFETYINNNRLTLETKRDINYVLKCIAQLKSAIGQQGLNDLKAENSEFKNVRNPEQLFNSIYSYLIYSNAMRNSPFVVCKTLLNPEYYSNQNIYEYVSAFSEYPVYLFSNWYFYFGNIMFNDIYIEKYKTELMSAYNTNKQLYDKNFYNDLINDINSYDDFKVSLIWLYSIKEFLQNLIDYGYWKYLPYFATSFTQTGISEDGKTLYNYYLPENQYLIPEIKTVISNFVKYFEQNGYMSDKFAYLLSMFNTLKDFNETVTVKFLDFTTQKKQISIGFSPLDKNFETSNSLENSQNLISINTLFLSTTNLGKLLKSEYFFKDIEFDINDLDYYGLSENIRDFYKRILLRTQSMDYVLCYDTMSKGKSNLSSIYWICKSEKLRNLFFNGHTFSSTKNNKEVLTSIQDFKNGYRDDILVYDRDLSLDTLVDGILSNDKFKKDLQTVYDGIKQKYNEYRQSINNDLKFCQQLIDTQTANFLAVLDKYPQYDSSLSYAYTGKYDVYLWNIYKLAQSLGLNNKSYLSNIEKHLIPVYKLENGFIQLETYFSPMFMLLYAKDDTDLSQSYYLINQEALNSLFNIGNEKFEEKIKEYKDLVSLTIQPEIAVINHTQIIEDISNNIKTMYSLSQDEMIDLIGSQEDEFIMIQNILNQEILENTVKECDVVNSETLKALETNKEVADLTNEKIIENQRVLDKNKIIKYAIVSGLALIFLNRGK